MSPRADESIYLRARFDVDDPKSIASLFLKIRYDDGFCAYINGQEVARDNVRDRAPHWRSRATRARNDSAATVFANFDVSAGVRFLKK